jgi:hypothetical protein
MAMLEHITLVPIIRTSEDWEEIVDFFHPIGCDETK